MVHRGVLLGEDTTNLPQTQHDAARGGGERMWAPLRTTTWACHKQRQQKDSRPHLNNKHPVDRGHGFFHFAARQLPLPLRRMPTMRVWRPRTERRTRTSCVCVEIFNSRLRLQFGRARHSWARAGKTREAVQPMTRELQVDARLSLLRSKR